MRHRVRLSLFIAASMLLPACSHDTEVLGPETPPPQMNVIPDHRSAPAGPSDDDHGRAGRYAMAAS